MTHFSTYLNSLPAITVSDGDEKRNLYVFDEQLELPQFMFCLSIYAAVVVVQDQVELYFVSNLATHRVVLPVRRSFVLSNLSTDDVKNAISEAIPIAKKELQMNSKPGINLDRWNLESTIQAFNYS